MLPNYHQVSDDIWRSGRPSNADDFAMVKSKFRTVVSLEGVEEDTKEENELGGSVLIKSFPITFFQIYFSGIKRHYLDNIIDAVDLIEKPLLVHCQHGQDRTGLVIGAWRVRHLWTRDQAWNEALKYGYRNWLNFGLNKTWDLLEKDWRQPQ